MVKKIGSFCTLVCLPACLLADFSYEQTTKMTGGAMMGMMKIAGAFSKQLREPVQTTVSVKGNRMVHWSKDHAQIIDLDSENITDVNFPKKQYSVITFAEMTQAMEQAMQRGQGKKSESKEGKPSDTTTEFKVDIKETGQRKQIAGYDAKQMIMTMQMDATDQKTGNKGGMVVTNDMWIAPKIAGYDEVQAFHRKMAAKMAWTPGGAAMMAGGADIARGMAGISKEVAKLDGITLLMVMRMTPTADGQPVNSASGSEAQAPAQQSRPKQETPSIGGVLGGKLGGFGGFGRKKKAEAPKEEKQESASTSAPSGDASATLMEMTTEMTGFSSAAVDPSKFAVPSGFKKVESEMQRRQR
jgi:hypothetical protein